MSRLYLLLPSIFLTKNIPLPWQLASGLTMNVKFFLFFSAYALNYDLYEGNIHVKGKKSYSVWNFFLIFIRFLPKWFFLDKQNIPGKWLIFWWGFIFPNSSGWTALSVQHKSQLFPSCPFFYIFIPNFLHALFTTGYLVSINSNEYTWYVAYYSWLMKCFIFFNLIFTLDNLIYFLWIWRYLIDLFLDFLFERMKD